MSNHLAAGKVYLVGAGPGDPALMTLRGMECLKQADVVLFDYLVDPAIVEHAPPSAERVRLARHTDIRLASWRSVMSQMIEAAQRGKTVVRLKGGDPAVFGRLAEEMAELGAAGISVEVVPGVTAGLAAAAQAEIPVTRGGHSSAVALVTGRQRGDKTTAQLDYAALAKFPGTLVFYMGIGTAAEWSAALIEEGKSPQTPVAIVHHCSWPDQSVTHCVLGTVADVVIARRIRPPAVVIVGDVAAQNPTKDKEQRE